METNDPNIQENAFAKFCSHRRIPIHPSHPNHPHFSALNPCTSSTPRVTKCTNVSRQSTLQQVSFTQVDTTSLLMALSSTIFGHMKTLFVLSWDRYINQCKENKNNIQLKPLYAEHYDADGTRKFGQNC